MKNKRRSLPLLQEDKFTNGGFDHTYLIDEKLAFDAEVKAGITLPTQPKDGEFGGGTRKIKLAAEVLHRSNESTRIHNSLCCRLLQEEMADV